MAVHDFARPVLPVLTLTVALLVTGCSNDDPVASSEPGATLSATPSSTGSSTGTIAFRRFFDADESKSAIFVIAPDGSGERQVTQPPAGTRDDDPDWSPDGSHLLFTRYGRVGTDDESAQLFTVAADGGNLTAISPDPKPTAKGIITGGDAAGVYSPDGTHIASGHYGGHIASAGQHGVIEGDVIEKSNVVVMDADGGNRRDLTTFPAYSGDATSPAWSPDGKEVLFLRSNGAATLPLNGQALLVVGVDGTHQRRVTPWDVGAGAPADWSPAADLIVFRAVQDEESGVGNFFTVRPDGTALTQVTHFTDTTISHKVGFSPDGERIVYSTRATGSNQLFTVRLDGSDERRVATSSYADSSPDWSSA